MKKLLLVAMALSLVLCACEDRKTRVGSSDVLIKEYFADDDTYVIICKGFPKEGLTSIQASESAKEAAVINAQMLAKEKFNDSVDVFKNGIVDKYDLKEGYATVEYIVKYPKIKSQQR
jgi:hypothetical protein